MNSVEAGRMLAIIATIDPKLPQPDDAGFMRRLWADMLDHVPADAAERAVHSYYQSERYLQHRNTISPADIVQWWNARRRPNERERDADRNRPEFDATRIHNGVHGVVAAIAERKAITAGTDAADARAASEAAATERSRLLVVPCPRCRAAVGEPCIGPNGPLRKSPCHPSRRDAALQGDPS